MFDNSKIQIAASGMVGFNNSTHPFYKYMNAVRKSSGSGYWVNALQGADLFTIEALLPSQIKDINLTIGEHYIIRTSDGGDFTNVGAEDNDAGTEFTATGEEPTEWGNSILELKSCNQYLDDVFSEEIIHLATRFINNSKAYLKQNTLLANHSVIGGVADKSRTITKSGRFVGFALSPHEGNNIVNEVTKIGFLGTEAFDGMSIYLYETSLEDPIAEYEFVYGTGLVLQWHSVTDFTVKYDNLSVGEDGSYTGGIGQKYLLGYFEDDLTGNAIEMEFNQSLKNFSIFGKYMAAFPIAIPANYLNGTSLPSGMLNLGSFITENTHGLYFKFTANCDYTNLIVDNIELFAQPLQYAIAIRILEDAVASVGNGIHNPTKDASIPEWRKLIAKYSGILNGGYITIGEQAKYQKGLIELLTMDFSGIDSVCFKNDPNEWAVGNLM